MTGVPPRTPEPPRLLSEAMGHGALSVVESQLSPALLLHTTSRVVVLFAPYADNHSGPPHYVAFGANGPKIVTNGTPADVSKIQERWILAWFEGAQGWERSDCPMGILLQHAPSSLQLNDQGLRLEFAQGAGDISLMPIYGSRLIPSTAAELASSGFPREELKRLPKVWEWSQAVPRDPLTRVRYWASALLRYPFHAWGFLGSESSQPGGYRFHARFEWHPLPCDWQLPPLIVCPVSPSLEAALSAHGAEVQFSQRTFDMDWPTPVGPLMTVPETDHYSVLLRKPETPGDGGEWRWPAVGRKAPAAGAFEGVGVDKQWREWVFPPSTEPILPVMPLRIREGTRILELVGTNVYARALKSLGALRLGPEELTFGGREMINGNTRVTRWNLP